eukprot:7387556-Prymnesium_polylepis.1
MQHANVDDDEEAQTIAYIGKNSVHGTRAQDEWWLDRADVVTQAKANGFVPKYSKVSGKRCTITNDERTPQRAKE